MKSIATLLLFALLFLTRLADAQTPPVVEIGRSFNVAWNHSGPNTEGFRVYIDNVRIVELPLSVLQGGSGVTRIAPTVVTARGAHTLAVSAYNADAESARASLAFEARLPSPDPPANLTIQIVMTLQPDGSVSVDVAPTLAQ